MEQTDFFNLYVQNLVNEVSELTKTKILNQARLEYKDGEIGELRNKITEIEEQSAKDKEDTMKSWQSSLKDKDNELAVVNDNVANMRRQNAAKDATIQRLENELNSLNNDVRNKEQIIAELNNQIHELSTRQPKITNIRKKKTNSNVVRT